MIKDEMKNRISMALKDPILQQGFECICKELETEKKLNEEIKVRFVKCNTCTDEMKSKCLMFSENLCEGDRCEELVDLMELINKSDLQKENARLKEALAEQKQYNAFKCEDNKKTIDNLKQENAELKKSVNNWLKYEKETQYHKSIIKDLKKENVELKELLNCNNCSELAEEELSINGIYEDLVDNALSEPNGRFSPYTKARLMKRAKEIYYKKDNQGE